MTLLGLGYLGIGAKDIQAWRVYAREVLGCMTSESPNGGLLLRIDEREWRIAIEPTGEDDVTFLGWEVSGPDALEEARQRLERAGVEVCDDKDLAEKRGVLALIRFVDPRGVQSEIFWGATEAGHVPFASPVGTSGFLTGPQGLGHVVLSTHDLEGLTRFYIDALGMNISDHIEDPRMGEDRIVHVTFLHTNPRHHSLALAAVPAPKKLLHFMLQTNSFDDVGFAMDRVQQKQVPMSLSLGRHVNDHMVSFYAFTPSGFEVEYGWGARCIDEDWTVVRHKRISNWGHHTINFPGTVSDWRPQ